MALGTPDSITRIVVAVPACDEADTIEDCLNSVTASAAHLTHPPECSTVTAITVIVACDSCVDDTAAVVRRYAQPPLVNARRTSTTTRLDIRPVVGTWSSAGGARRAAVAQALAVLSQEDPNHCATHFDGVWIATTDADSSVSEDWLVRQLHYAADGFDAVAGIVELIEPDAEASGAFRRIYSLTAGREHAHVHGANLGVRASAYLAAGGFPAIAVSEDHALWNRLRRDGRRCISPLDVVVRTSARRIGRAPGGFADTLAAAIRAEGQAG